MTLLEKKLFRYARDTFLISTRITANFTLKRKCVIRKSSQIKFVPDSSVLTRDVLDFTCLEFRAQYDEHLHGRAYRAIHLEERIPKFSLQRPASHLEGCAFPMFARAKRHNASTAFLRVPLPPSLEKKAVHYTRDTLLVSIRTTRHVSSGKAARNMGNAIPPRANRESRAVCVCGSRGT